MWALPAKRVNLGEGAILPEWPWKGWMYLVPEHRRPAAWFAAALFALSCALAGPASPLLRTVSAIRALSPADAASERGVRIQGVVTAIAAPGAFFLTDSTGGISVRFGPGLSAVPGDRVTVAGHTASGAFAPMISADSVHVTGHGALPRAGQAGYEELMNGCRADQWVAVKGVVRSATFTRVDRTPVATLRLDLGAGAVSARIPAASPAQAGVLPDAEVNVSGVCRIAGNPSGRALVIELLVPGIEWVRTVRPAPADPFAESLSPLGAFPTFKPGSLPHRIHTSGILTARTSSGRLYLQDGVQTLTAIPSDPEPKFEPGTRVEAVGFPDSAAEGPQLEDVVIKASGRVRAPRPLRITAASVLRNSAGPALSPYEGLLVELEGTVVEHLRPAGGHIWILRDGENVFEARLGVPHLTGGLDQLPEGQTARARGILVSEPGDGQTRSFHLLLRSPEDLSASEPAWWRATNFLVLAGMTFLVIVGLIGYAIETRNSPPDVHAVADEAQERAGEIHRRASRMAAWCAALLSAVGLVTSLFYQAGLAPAASITGMAPNAALGLLLISLSLLLRARRPPLARTFAIAAASLGLAAVLAYLLPVRWRLDEVWTAGRPTPFQMAFLSAVGITFLGLAALSSTARRGIAAGQILAAFTGALALVDLVGLLYGAEALYRTPGSSAMTAATATAVMLLAFALMSAEPSQGPMGSLTSKAPGGVMARYLLPVAISLPAILGWLSLVGQRHGFYNAAEGVALLASASLLVLGFLVWAAARLLNRLDARRSGAEAALRESEARFRLLADAMPTIVWSALADGKLDYCNRHWLEYTGFSLEQSLASGWTAALHPDDVPQALESWKKSLETGEPHEAEYRFRRASDGSYRWHLGRAVPARDSAGAITRWFGACTDIEDYKRAEAEIRLLNEKLEDRVRARTAELAATEARLRGVLEAATQVAIIAVDTNRVIRIFNPGAERMLGYRAEQVVGQCSPDLFHDRAECEVRAAELTAEFGRPVAAEDVFLVWARQGRAEERAWSYVRKDGTRLRVRLAITPLRGPDGGIQGFLGVATDITSHIALEAELRETNARLVEQTHRAEEANRAKTRFLASMSHEIRTPMNAILGMADVLWDTRLDSEQRQYVEVFRHAGGLLLNLINDILDLSKIETVGVRLEQIDFDLENLIDECVELSAPRAREKRLRLVARIVPGTQTALRGDPSRLRQVLLNLVGNALKFTAEGQIALTVSNHASGLPGHIEIAVADTGIGIPRDRLGAIFEEFEQADTSTTRRYGGTGLGLSISRLLVEKMGGSISVESQVGQGTTLRFDARLGVAAAAHARESESPLAGCRALLVAPDAAFRQVLVEALESFGMTCGFDLSGDYRVALIGGLPGDVRALGRLAASGVPLVLAAADPAAAQAVERSRFPLAGRVMLPVSRRALRKLVCDAMALRPARVPVQRSQTPRQALPGAPLRILIAEDVAGNRFLLQAFLKDTQHQIVFAEDGAQAVEHFKQGPFDIVFMDMQMPVMDGLQAVAAIRDIERGQGQARKPVIALTASAYAEDVEAAHLAGCDGHLAKPVSKSTFLDTIAQFTVPVSSRAASAGRESPNRPARRRD